MRKRSGEKMTQDLVKRLQDKEERMIEIRRHLHEHPELSFKETLLSS